MITKNYQNFESTLPLGREGGFKVLKIMILINKIAVLLLTFSGKYRLLRFLYTRLSPHRRFLGYFFLEKLVKKPAIIFT
jgi:hypothetical protein